ncbi:MAG: hypothetical protein STSR0008_21710 [Ignavibacterium sp.]
MKKIKNNFLIKHFLFFVLTIIFFRNIIISETKAQVVEDFPIPNGNVTSVVQDGDTLYLGGKFTHWGKNAGNGILLDKNTGIYDPSFPKVNGTIYCSAPDGEGGVFIGGKFTKVGDENRNSLAHIRSDGTIDNWNPNLHIIDIDSNNHIQPWINAISVHRDVIYIGGVFLQVGDSTRNYLAAVDYYTGIATSWNPDPNSTIDCIAATDTVVYIAGGFNEIRITETLRNGIAAIYSNNGFPTKWYPPISMYTNLSFMVKGMLLADNDSTLYVWGNIGWIGSSQRYGAAALKTYTNISSDYALPWNPKLLRDLSIDAAGIVYALEISGDTIYLGGDFYYAKSRTESNRRNLFAAVTKSGTGTLLNLNPNVTGQKRVAAYEPYPAIYSIKVIDDKIYFSGFFDSVGVIERNNIASIDKNGNLLDFNPNIGLDVVYPEGIYTILNWNQQSIFAGGKLRGVNGKTRFSLASIDLKTKEITDWNPDVYGINNQKKRSEVESLALYKSNILVGGYFKYVGGIEKPNLALVDKITGIASDIDFGIPWGEGGVGEISVYNDYAFLGGWFYTVGGKQRSGIAQVDLITGAATDWYPGENRSPYSIIPTDSLIYIAGIFSSVGDSSRIGLAAIDTRTGEISSFNHSLKHDGGDVSELSYTISLVDSILFVGGIFTTIDDSLIQYFAGINLKNNSVLDLNKNVNRPVYSIYNYRSLLFIGGDFTSVNDLTRNGAAAFDINDNFRITDFNPNITDFYYNLSPYVTNILFDSLNNQIFISHFNSSEIDGKYSPHFIVYKFNYNSPQVIFSTNSIDFDTVKVGESKELTFSIVNLLNKDFQSDSIIITDNSFSIYPEIISIPNGETFVDTVKFMPLSEGTFNGKIIFYSNSPFSPDTILISGIGKNVVDVKDNINIPNEFALSQNYPNPFNPSTKINYQLPVDSYVSLKIYDVLGKEVITLLNEQQSAGFYQKEFNAKGLSSGMYFYKLEAGNFVQVRKMILLK